VLFGAIGDPKYDNDQKQSATGARIVEIEKVFANIRPIKPYSTLLDSSPLKKKLLKVLILYRELTGGVYFGEKN
jgi:3-isopropylmalate dehydrogenase